jgi:hypothetical protein
VSHSSSDEEADGITENNAAWFTIRASSAGGSRNSRNGSDVIASNSRSVGTRPSISTVNVSDASSGDLAQAPGQERLGLDEVDAHHRAVHVHVGWRVGDEVQRDEWRERPVRRRVGSPWCCATASQCQIESLALGASSCAYLRKLRRIEARVPRCCGVHRRAAGGWW